MNEEPTAPSPARQTIIVRPEQGRVLEAFGDKVQVKLNGGDIQGSLVLALDSVPPGNGPPPHIHHQEDELFIVMEGSFRFLADDGWSEPVGPGGVVYTPRGVRHSFQNAGSTTGRLWILATPSGFEQFFGECAEVFAAGNPPDLAKILRISSEHAIEYVPPLEGAPS